MAQGETYTINEAAGLTGLHKNTIRQRIRLGQLKATIEQGKFGEEYRIPHDALVEAGLLAGSPLESRDGPTHAAEFETEPDSSNGAASSVTGALTELYQRHEQAMFRLGYMQGELDRVKALAETAESLRRDNEEQRQEVSTLRSALDEKERQAGEAETLRRDLEAARQRLQEMETLRENTERLRTLAAEQEAMIEALETAQKRPWWKLW
jgi:excisionase family DNA binding protein